jgi:GINS complex subunit 4
MSTPENSENVPRFSFGEMALTAEPGRAVVPERLVRTESLGGEAGLIGALRDPLASINETILKLRYTALNEEHSPEILPYADEVIAEVRGLVAKQTEFVDEEEDVESSLEAHFQRIELDRLNYMLRCYFRVRIKKIERSILYVVKDTDIYARLSEAEQNFAVAYMDLVEDHFNKSFLSMLPERLRSLEKDGNVDFAAGPDLDRFVFCQVLKTLGQYSLSDDVNDEPLDLTEGDALCVRYTCVRELLLSGDVGLI